MVFVAVRVGGCCSMNAGSEFIANHFLFIFNKPFWKFSN